MVRLPAGEPRRRAGRNWPPSLAWAPARLPGGPATAGFDWTTPVETAVPISMTPALDGHEPRRRDLDTTTKTRRIEEGAVGGSAPVRQADIDGAQVRDDRRLSWLP